MERVTFQVRGIHCVNCEQRIEQALKQLPGTLRSTADHAAGTVAVVFDASRTSAEAARGTIERAGFEVTP